jgi:hypothetical protein
MAFLLDHLPTLCAAAGAWAVLNGLLHDIFVLRAHFGKPGHAYDRDLLRLLMDGHVLMTCGLLQIIARQGLLPGRDWGFSVAGVATASLLIYCGMIFPFLKSFGMTLLNAALGALLISGFVQR